MANEAELADFWEMRDGDHITITNRWDDLPTWFELHPTETGGLLSYKMLAKLEAGYRPKEIMEGPNIWRIKAGDRVVWLGDSRPEQQAEQGVLALVVCNACALMVGESSQPTFETMLAFGAVSDPEPGPVTIARLRAGAKVVGDLGLPRKLSLDWRLGL
jgi:hypothetical protein